MIKSATFYRWAAFNATQRNATRLAINVAKILGIIAALITIRFMLQAIHKGVLGEDPSC